MGHSKGSPEGKFIPMSAYIKKTERSQINNLMIHLKILEKQGIGKNFLNGYSAAQQLKDSIDKWDFIKLKSFF
jgi:hypothetical protein